MEKYYYRITLQYPESKKIIEHDMVLDKEVSLYAIPSIAVENDIIDAKDVNYITAVSQIEEVNSKAQFRQANQVILKPRPNYGTGKQFSHLMKDLQINNDDYAVMLDIGNITKDEITVVIYPNIFDEVEGMTKRTIGQVISTLNLNSTKTVSVNYVLLDEIKDDSSNNDDTEYGWKTYSNDESCETESCCGECNECDEACCECDECDENCECYKDPEFDCCKSCDITDDCGCYIQKTNRHEFKYHENKHDIPKNSINDNEPEKTLRIPVEPLNPNEEIIMLANAIAKRLKIGFKTYSNVEISVCRGDDGSIESFVSIHRSDDETYQL